MIRKGEADERCRLSGWLAIGALEEGAAYGPDAVMRSGLLRHLTTLGVDCEDGGEIGIPISENKIARETSRSVTAVMERTEQRRR